MPSPFDPLTHPGPVPSPCISLCVMAADTGLCQGCQRTIAEIAGWSGAGEAGRRAIWRAILERRRHLPPDDDDDAGADHRGNGAANATGPGAGRPDPAGSA